MSKDMMEVARGMISGLAAKQSNHFLLSWNGTKIPRGASIDANKIGWTQNGIVQSENGKWIGYYERITEFSGPNGQRHDMLISTDGKEIIPPPGGSVQQIVLDNQPANIGPDQAERPPEFPG